MVGWILLGIAVVVVLGAVALYRGIVTQRNHTETAWSRIEVQLSRRHDLIPRLVETAKGSATAECDALVAVIEARMAALGAGGVAERFRAEQVVTSALTSLFAVAPADPGIRADQRFLDLQAELSGTERRIAYARQFYNDTALRYNARITSFPALAVAGPLRYRQREYFEAGDSSEDQVPTDF